MAFGLAVNDTIHILNRFELESRGFESVAIAIHRSICLIGTVLILTTLVLIAGMLVTQTSVAPPTRQFGLICVCTLIFALLADLFVLPALILCASRWIDRSRRGKATCLRTLKALPNNTYAPSEEQGRK